MLKTVLGIMTGTSCDGINGAILRTDGEYHIEHLSFCEVPFSQNISDKLLKCGQEAQKLGQVNRNLKHVQDLEQEYTKAIIDFVKTYFDLSKIDLIGFHGQTILHLPDQQITVQLGLPEMLANATGKNVIFNFRQNDLNNGGQGAPLAPLYHLACLHNMPKPACFYNIGGVSNVTYDNHITMGFDIGPGNCISDDFCQYFYGLPYDIDGKIAASGTIHHNIVAEILDQKIFKQKPPKSFDRNEFDISILKSLDPKDAIATANFLTASAIIQADKLYPELPKIRIISGGGVYNNTLVKHLKELSRVPVKTAEEIGLNNSAVEAECFAWLAVRSIKGLPLSLPSITGVKELVSGGDLYQSGIA